MTREVTEEYEGPLLGGAVAAAVFKFQNPGDD